MTDNDFSYCPFIKRQLCFVTYIDFCQNATLIKISFLRLPNDAKIFYKWYIYANIHMDEYHKNLIWNYLNEDESESYSILIENIKTCRAR